MENWWTICKKNNNKLNKMMTYLVIGICIFLLLAVIYISAKPISMGIEARRNIKDKNLNDKSK